MEDFSADQQRNKEKTSELIQQYSERCRANVKAAIDDMLGDLRNRIMAELALDEEQRKANPSSSAMT